MGCTSCRPRVTSGITRTSASGDQLRSGSGHSATAATVVVLAVAVALALAPPAILAAGLLAVVAAANLRG